MDRVNVAATISRVRLYAEIANQATMPDNTADNKRGQKRPPPAAKRPERYLCRHIRQSTMENQSAPNHATTHSTSTAQEKRPLKALLLTTASDVASTALQPSRARHTPRAQHTAAPAQRRQVVSVSHRNAPWQSVASSYKRIAMKNYTPRQAMQHGAVPL